MKHNQVITIGDFNFPDINWQSMSANCSTSLSLFDFTDPTHCKSNLLDLITNSPDLIQDGNQRD